MHAQAPQILSTSLVALALWWPWPSNLRCCCTSSAMLQCLHPQCVSPWHSFEVHSSTDITRTAGLAKLWPGAHRAAISMSRSNSLKRQMCAHLTDSSVLCWSVPYFITTFGNSSRCSMTFFSMAACRPSLNLGCLHFACRIWRWCCWHL